jgi:hypothetical protein
MYAEWLPFEKEEESGLYSENELEQIDNFMDRNLNEPEEIVDTIKD